MIERPELAVCDRSRDSIHQQDRQPQQITLSGQNDFTRVCPSRRISHGDRTALVDVYKVTWKDPAPMRSALPSAIPPLS
jgi:hypothetical protein